MNKIALKYKLQRNLILNHQYQKFANGIKQTILKLDEVLPPLAYVQFSGIKSEFPPY